MTYSTPSSRHDSLKYGGKAIILIEQPDGQYTLLNFYHAPIATDTLENLLPLIRAHEPLPKCVPTDLDDLVAGIDFSKLGV